MRQAKSPSTPRRRCTPFRAAHVELAQATKSRGFTLLEVLLALALTIIVIGAISYAIFFHLRVLDNQRTRVEQSLVARGTLNMMAQDIRAAVQYKPVDVSQLEALLASVDLATLLASPSGADLLQGALDGGLDVGDALGSEALGGGALGDVTGGGDAGTDDLVAEGEEGPRPGLYGTSTELEVDISRMPRRDQYIYGLQTSANDYASDLRTVIYRLVATNALEQELGDQMPTQPQPLNANPSGDISFSLVRTTISQPVRRFQENLGGNATFQGETEILASEVSSIQFRYLDGAEGTWMDEWDTDVMESLPTAVEIQVQFDFVPTGSAFTNNVGEETNSDNYRLVVHLPLAEPPASEEEDSGDDGSDSDLGMGDVQ